MNGLNPDATYLHPGEVCFCAEPSRVETVLGSCVAVTMWDRRRGAASICHAVLPWSNGDGGDPLRYVDSAIGRMLAALDAHGSRRQDIEVKLFGGASMHGNNRVSVGRQNVEAALATLASQGLKPQAVDTGGAQGRKLRFDTATGEVWLKRISAARTGPEAGD